MNRTALVAGASGLVGGHVLRLLLTDGAYGAVTSIGRRTLPLTHPKLTQRTADFDRLDALADFPRVDDVFCSLGTTMRRAGSPDAFRKVDYTYVVELARIAVRHRASQFLLVSAIGADRDSRVFYSRVKGETEAAVRAIPFDAIHVFRPSLLLGARSESRPLERVGIVVGGTFRFLFIGPLRRYRPVRADTVARAMIAAAKEGRRGVHVHEFDRIVELSRR